DAAASERVVHFFLALDDTRALVRREHHRAGDDQRVLIFLADLLPVLDVREDVLVRLEVLGVLDGRGLVGRRGLRRLAARLGLRLCLAFLAFFAFLAAFPAFAPLAVGGGRGSGLRRLGLHLGRPRRFRRDVHQR